jgi:hypothetical protein
MLGQIISRATRQQRDGAEPGSQLTEHLYHPGQPIAGPRQAGAKTTLPTIGTGHAAIEKS